MKKKILLLLVIALFSANFANSQFKDYKVKGGIFFAPILPFSEFGYEPFSFHARGFFGFEINRYFSLELGFGYAKYVTKDDFLPGGNNEKVSANVVPIGLRGRIYPIVSKTVNPYIFIGGGPMFYEVKEVPTLNALNYGQYVNRAKDWAGFIEGGIGMEVKLGPQVLLDFNGGVTYPFTDVLNNYNNKPFEDAWGHLGMGLTFTGKAGKDDTDKDGLLDDYEEQIGTDPENPDTDGDGLKDGQEVNTYSSNPKNVDSDADGLNDYDEVMKYRTSPTNPDTDGDGLNDYDEVMKHRTDPLKTDTDSDGLSDYDEVLKHKTDPLKADTDGDGLNDYDEVVRYKTDPRNPDTDNGSVNDGTEVARGTNPLDKSDDVKQEEIPEIGKVIILEGINFETSSSRITPGSEDILMKAYNTLVNNPNIVVEISGHTDSRGSNASNQNLSQSRADAVKDWLVAKGIAPDRIETVGYGEDKPIAPNDTDDNMYKNRRIEFKRIK